MFEKDLSQKSVATKARRHKVEF